MENRLKERLVGATVLVVLAVIFVPMVLDGPGNGARVERSVDLPPQDTDETGRRTVRLDLTRPDGQQKGETVAEEPDTAADASNDPVEVDLTAERATAETKPVAPERTEEKPPVQLAVKPEPEKPADSAEPEGEWTVQVGSFGQQANAEAQVARLKELGFEAHISRYTDGRSTLYRVRSGGFASREAAAAKAAEIKARSGQNARPALND